MTVEHTLFTSGSFFFLSFSLSVLISLSSCFCFFFLLFIHSHSQNSFTSTATNISLIFFSRTVLFYIIFAMNTGRELHIHYFPPFALLHYCTYQTKHPHAHTYTAHASTTTIIPVSSFHCYQKLHKDVFSLFLHYLFNNFFSFLVFHVLLYIILPPLFFPRFPSIKTNE